MNYNAKEMHVIGIFDAESKQLKGIIDRNGHTTVYTCDEAKPVDIAEFIGKVPAHEPLKRNEE